MGCCELFGVAEAPGGGDGAVRAPGAIGGSFDKWRCSLATSVSNVMSLGLAQNMDCGSVTRWLALCFFVMLIQSTLVYGLMSKSEQYGLMSKSEHRVDSLPGLNEPLKSAHYSGLMPVGSQNYSYPWVGRSPAVSSHYYLIEAEEATPQEAPLIIWLQGERLHQVEPKALEPLGRGRTSAAVVPCQPSPLRLTHSH